MPKEMDGFLYINIVIGKHQCEVLSAQEMNELIDRKLALAKEEIQHNLGLNDGTYELSQEIK